MAARDIAKIQLLIAKSGRLYICVVVWVIIWSFVKLATVLMLFWPLKMLKSSHLDWMMDDLKTF